MANPLLLPALPSTRRPELGSRLAAGHPKGLALTPARTAPHCQSREQGEGTTRSETKQDHLSRQYRMIIEQDQDSTSDCWPRRSRSRSAKALITRKAELEPENFERTACWRLLYFAIQRRWRFTAQSSPSGLLTAGGPRRAHGFRRRPGCGPCRANSSGSDPYPGGECLASAAQLRSCALSRAACRVR